MNLFNIKNISSECRARRGVLNLPHASAPVQTPVFMPVGTKATVKAMTQDELVELGFDIILGNTYHLYLRPGHELIQRAGGLHRFISWGGAMLTDSGGYQVFSLKDLRKITDDGVAFRSIYDGSKHFFSPEHSLNVQHALGADIIMAFDECPPYPCTHEDTKVATDRTHRWLDRCVTHHANSESEQYLFGIAQGGVYEDLRRESAEYISASNTPGVAIGGVSVGEPPDLMIAAVAWSIPFIPIEKPRYLMGVGTPQDLLNAVGEGVDMFDCVLPTRLGRTGSMYTAKGRVNIKGSRFTEDFGPVDPDCLCAVCRKYSAAYIKHLYKSNEILASRLATYHNLAHYSKLMADIRTAIEMDNYTDFKLARLSEYQTLSNEKESVQYAIGEINKPAELVSLLTVQD